MWWVVQDSVQRMRRVLRHGFALHVNVLVVLLLALPSTRPAAGLVECGAAPNCSDGLRMPCNPNGVPPMTVDNVCGNCVSGNHGGAGPSNTKCLTNQSCVLVYPGQTGCPEEGSSASVPFPVPFNRCQCDRDGLWWPTAANQCGIAVVTDPTGSGFFSLFQCPDSTCTLEKCVEVAVWSPMLATFPCQTVGADSFALSDSCTGLRGADGSRAPLSAFCGHNGVVAKAADDGVTVPLLPIDCELAPQCPYSVLSTSRGGGGDRLEQSCCTGNPDSFIESEKGLSTREQAPAFCAGVATGGGTNVLATADSVAGCPVRTSAPGWKGCACVDDRGLVSGNRVCTVECIPPACPLPEDGVIPATPEQWLTSKVPHSQGPETAAATNAAMWSHGATSWRRLGWLLVISIASVA